MTNQASEDELRQSLATLFYDDSYEYMLSKPDFFDVGAIDAVVDLIRTEKLKLLDELDKSMPTAEQLTTKYGYHMPDKQYGYKLALHDIREVIEAKRRSVAPAKVFTEKWIQGWVLIRSDTMAAVVEGEPHMQEAIYFKSRYQARQYAKEHGMTVEG